MCQLKDQPNFNLGWSWKWFMFYHGIDGDVAGKNMVFVRV